MPTESKDCPKCGSRIHADEHCPKCGATSPGKITRLEPLYNLCRRLEFETRQAALDKPRPNCPGCGNEIDPETCHCGDIRAAHDSMADHSFVPMGCECGRVKLPDDLNPDMVGWINGEEKQHDKCCGFMDMAIKLALIRENHGPRFGPDVLPSPLTVAIKACPWCGTKVAKP